MTKGAVVEKRLGTDNSKWEPGINWAIACQYMNFAINKATQGLTGVDSEFSHNKSGCITYEVPNGAYHFLMPNYSPTEQAVHFCRTVGSGINVYCGDVETTILLAANALYFSKNQRAWDANWVIDTRIQRSAEVKQFILTERQTEIKLLLSTLSLPLPTIVDTFMQEVIRIVGSRCVPVVYTSPGFWNTYMHYPDGTYPDWNGRYFLWVAHWGVEDPTLPRGWTSYKFHQFTDKLSLPGYQSNTDGDKMSGTVEDVRLFFGDQEPPPPPPPLPERIRINTSVLNIRNEPSALRGSLSVIGTTTLGKVWWVQGSANDEQGRMWYQVGKKVYLASWLCKPV